MFVIFDLDGTLSDPAHREHYVRRPVGQKDWDSFNREAVNDAPKLPIVETYRAFEYAGECNLHIWTGRDEAMRLGTFTWLEGYGIHEPILKMRPTGNRTPDDELKLSWLRKLSRKPDLVFEDRQRVVDMWRAQGITCCQVAPGDF